MFPIIFFVLYTTLAMNGMILFSLASSVVLDVELFNGFGLGPFKDRL